MITSPQRNKKLTPIRLRPTIRHTQNALPIMSQRRIKLILKLLAPDTLPARAVLARIIPALDHEPLNNAVKRTVIVFARVAEGREVLACLRRSIWVEGDGYFAHAGSHMDSFCWGAIIYF